MVCLFKTSANQPAGHIDSVKAVHQTQKDVEHCLSPALPGLPFDCFGLMFQNAIPNKLKKHDSVDILL